MPKTLNIYSSLFKLQKIKNDVIFETLCVRVLNIFSMTHTHSILTAIFPGEPGLAGCPLNSPSPFIPGLRILLGQT